MRAGETPAPDIAIGEAKICSWLLVQKRWMVGYYHETPILWTGRYERTRYPIAYHDGLTLTNVDALLGVKEPMSHLLPDDWVGQAFVRCDLVVLLKPVDESDNSVPFFISGRAA